MNEGYLEGEYEGPVPVFLFLNIKDGSWESLGTVR